MRSPLAVPLLALAVSGAMVGCGDGTGGAAAEASCAQPSAVAAGEPLPLDIAAHGVLTKVQRTPGFVAATVVSPELVEDLYAAMDAEAQAAGFDVVASDDEGIEFEIFLARGEGTSGLVRASQTTCEGQTLLELTISDGGATASHVTTPVATPGG